MTPETRVCLYAAVFLILAFAGMVGAYFAVRLRITLEERGWTPRKEAAKVHEGT